MDLFRVLGCAVLISMVTAAPPLPLLDDMFCHVCADAVDNSDCKNTISCDIGHTHCLTEMFYDDGAITIEKRCAKMQVCYNMEENNAEGCDNPDDRTEGYCAYCCSTPGCNAQLPPYFDNESYAPAPDSENDESCDDDDDDEEDDDDDDDDDDDNKSRNRCQTRAQRPGPNSGGPVKDSHPPPHGPASQGRDHPTPPGHGPNSQPHTSKVHTSIAHTSQGRGHPTPPGRHGPNSQPHTSKAHTSQGRDHPTPPGRHGPNSQPHTSKAHTSRAHTSQGRGHPTPPGPNSRGHTSKAHTSRVQTGPVSSGHTSSGFTSHTHRHTTPTAAPQPTQATQAPNNNGNNSGVSAATSVPSGGSQVSTCHCHNGQPCTQMHVQTPTGGNTGSLLFPGLNIDLNIHISGGQIAIQPQAQAQTCPCQQQSSQQGKSSPVPTAGSTSTAAVTMTIPPDTPRAVTSSPATTAAPTTTAATTTTKKPAVTTFPPATTAAVTSAATTTTKKPATATIPPDTTLPPATAPPTTTTAAPTTTTTTPAPTTTTTSTTTTTTPAPTTTTTTTTPAPTTTTTTTTPAPTTTTTTTTPAPTTTTTTTTTTAPTTTTPGPTQCYHCHDSQCHNQYLRDCPMGYNYCLNRVTQRIDGTRTFEKSCVPTATCDTQWWQKTAGHADCFLLDDSAKGRTGNPLSSCSFCCHGNGCNRHTIPDVTSLYNPNQMP